MLRLRAVAVIEPDKNCSEIHLELWPRLINNSNKNVTEWGFQQRKNVPLNF